MVTVHLHSALDACADCIIVEACLALIQLKKQPEGTGEAADKKKGKKQAAGEMACYAPSMTALTVAVREWF